MIAEDVTACVATYRRPDELRRTLTTLLAGETVPGTVLVSEGSAHADDRRAVHGAIQALGPSEVTIVLLPPPPNGQRCGNRNWLACHVRTPLALFLDDDIDVPATFVKHARRDLKSASVGIVVAASEEIGGPGWLTHRCHFRPARPGDPIAVGFQLVVWRTELFRSLWLDENIVFGSEESDVSIRLYEQHARAVCRQSSVCFRDRAAPVPSGALDGRLRRDAAERSRSYVAVRRYRASRLALWGFLAHEVAANVARRRRPLPRGLVPGQWPRVLLHLIGGKRPAFTEEPRVSVRA